MSRREAPVWSPPFEPSLERALDWLRKRATGPVLRNIAEAEIEYDPRVRDFLQEFLRTGDIAAVPESRIYYESCELVSNHWCEDGPNARMTMLVGGAVFLLLAFGDEEYSPLTVTSRIARTMHGAIEVGGGAIEATLDVLAWCAKRQAPGEREAPASLLFAASLCGASVLSVEYSKARRAREGFGWVSASVCEALAPQVEELVERDIAFEPPLAGAHEWLVCMDEFREGPPWWGLARATIGRIGDGMPRVGRVLERMLASCPTWRGR